MRHIYAFHDHPISEEMLLGIGSGVGFIYWHMKGMPPMLGGRANVARPGEEGLEITAGRRTGVEVERHHTGSSRVAQKTLLEQLESGEPVMLIVDMGFLPYFTDLPEDFHFGAHAVVIGGYDHESGTVLVADRDDALHPVSLEDLAQSRGSTYKPFPPRNTRFTFDFTGKREPSPEEVWKSIRESCTNMLDGPISNIGVRGIRKAAERIRKWPDSMDEEQLRWACFNSFIFIDAEGGTGGGIFRYMYGRFLEEAATITGEDELAGIGAQFGIIGDHWQEIATTFKGCSEHDDPSLMLSEISNPLISIADQEEAAWKQLYGLTT